MKEYDLALTWDKNECLFTESLARSCREKSLSFIRVHEGNLKDITGKLEAHKLRLKVVLDTEATYDVPDEPYSRLNYAAKDGGGIVINDPDRTRIAVDKAVMHYELMDAGIDIPYTVILREWESDPFRLTTEEKKRLGRPFIIKPGCGWGHQGVVHEAIGTAKEIKKARRYDPGDHFLLQEKIEPAELGGKRAWFRIFHLFDRILPCWWDDRTSRYEQMTLAEFKKFKLSTIVKYVTKIADITRLVWFSTEIALDGKQKSGRFVAIDYVNDQCDMEAQSENGDGVPDNIVRLTAGSIVGAAEDIVRGKAASGQKGYGILFRDDETLAMKGLGRAPGLLAQRAL